MPPSRWFTRHPSLSNSENDDVDSDGGSSSANEYAEGLGCADRKRCREQPNSGFEFDNHPREEYFEQPKSHYVVRNDFDDVDLGCATKRQALSTAPGCSLVKCLTDLEQLESESISHDHTDRQSRFLQKFVSPTCRSHERRGLEEQSVHSNLARGCEPHAPRTTVTQTVHAKATCAANNGDVKFATIDTNWLVHCCTMLATIRNNTKAHSMKPAEITTVLRLLGILAQVNVDVPLLKKTGLGLELNHVMWRRHPAIEIASRSAALVAKWRKTVVMQQQQKLSRP